MENKKVRGAVLGAALAIFASTAASAAPVLERHLGTFGSPVEWRLECVKWAKPWPGAKICVGHAYQNLQHKFVLRVDGPSADEAVINVLREALAASAAAAAGAGILTPSPEPAGRVAAALAAAKTAFVGYLAARGLERLINQYRVVIDHQTYWG